MNVLGLLNTVNIIFISQVINVNEIVKQKQRSITEGRLLSLWMVPLILNYFMSFKSHIHKVLNSSL